LPPRQPAGSLPENDMAASLPLASLSTEAGATTEQPRARHVFFPNLNGLRFLAVLLVIFNHVEWTLKTFDLPNFITNAAVLLMGQLGVTLFFVLSGFLITYLLLREKATFGQINFGAFYLRRILRIWPLYYVVVILSLFVLPHIAFLYYPNLTPLVHEQLLGKTVLYGLILPNVAKEVYPMVPYLLQAWSIGVEEQFYIIWPLLIHFSSHYFRNILLLAGAIVVATQLSWILTSPARHILPVNELTDFIKNFLISFRIQCMAIGGLFALLLFRNKTDILKLITARYVQIGVLLLLLVMIARGQAIPYFTHEVYGILFGVMVLNLALTDSSVLNLRYKWLDYLGRISYGLYMLHSIAIVVSVWIFNRLLTSTHPLLHLAVFLGSVVISIGMAAVSYHYLENPFLRLKKRFTRIQSGS
jgi:peptidoglycan/LPS O-acetylase OafA/YrhL